MINPVLKRIIVSIILTVILIGIMPTGEPVYAFNFQVDEGLFQPGEDTGEKELVDTTIKVGILEQKIAEFIRSILHRLKDIFGLYTIDQMVYNKTQGDINLWWIDGYNNRPESMTIAQNALQAGNISEGEQISPSRSYYMGIMPEKWYEGARNMHLIFQAIAWSILSIAIVKNLLQISVGTMNPMMKFRFYDAVRDLFLTGFLLAGSLLIIETMFVFNERLVDIFATTIPSGSFAGIANDGTFASLLLQGFYFFIEIYLNFIYIIRAISISVLIATAPLFIVSITFEGKNMLFMKWFKEITSNIFLQSFHAFFLSFLLGIQLTASGFESLVILFALVPLTEFFRSIILGDSGKMAGMLGMGAVTAGAGMLAGGAKALEGNKRDKDTSKDKSNGYNPGGTFEKGGSGPEMKTSKEKLENTPHGPANKTTAEALNAFSSEADVRRGIVSEDDPYSKTTNKKNIDNKNIKDDVAKPFLKGSANLAAGAALVGTGIGVSAITGGKYGSGFAGQGAKRIASGGSSLGGAAGDWYKINSDDGRVKGGGNIIQAETLPNGKFAVHRDKSEVANDGLVDVRSDYDTGNHTFTYDYNKMNPENKERLMGIYNNYNNNKNRDELRNYGLERVTMGKDNKIRVEANRTYLSKMGIEGMYQTGNRFVEQKNLTQSKHTDIVPNLNFKPKVDTTYADNMRPPDA